MYSNDDLLYSSKEVKKMVAKIAESILEHIPKSKLDQLALIGIQSRGVPFAEEIAKEINKKCGTTPPIALIDINMYRDDIGIRKNLPHIHPTVVPFDLDEKIILLIDDVLHTGRTIRAALDAITYYGRPDFIKLAVLIDRGGQEFPIRADYVGESVDVKSEESVVVLWKKLDHQDGVFLSSNQKKES
jgi:pyrimidine operon attenuation protein / uracil phosphoribosyltransferase